MSSGPAEVGGPSSGGRLSVATAVRMWLAGLLVRARIVGSAIDVSRNSQLSLVAAVATDSSRACAVPFAPRITYATDPDALELVGLAGPAGVAATGVVLARGVAQRHY